MGVVRIANERNKVFVVWGRMAVAVSVITSIVINETRCTCKCE